MSPPDGDWPEARHLNEGVEDESTAAYPEPGNVPGRRPTRTLAPGQILADRYSVVRFIARGGMGEVYEVEDLVIRGRVALKTIPPEVAADPEVLERFKREVYIARKVTHPNVCRLYDLGSHRITAQQGASDPREKLIFFLTMELLAGETLSQRISRQGRMSATEALPIIEQMVAALDAAHSVGIIHRDFKSGNVNLVPVRAGSGEVRAVVTDFGIARPTGPSETLGTMTETGAMLGTPAYMAPEQVEGKRLGPAADIYALGVVIYEMTTGVRPFNADSPIAVAARRLTEAPMPPRQHEPKLGPVWNSVILRCLEREPDRRFQSATEVLRALHGVAEPRPIREAPAKRTLVGRFSSLRVPGLVAAAILLLLLGVRAWRPGSRVVETVLPTGRGTSIVPRRSVAVVDLKNDSARPDSAWLSTAIAESLSTELAAGEKLRVVGRSSVSIVQRELGVGQSETWTGEVLSRLRRNLGADVVAAGSYNFVGEPESQLLRIDVRLVDTATGKIMASNAATGTEAQLNDLVARAGRVLRQALRVGEVSPAQALQIEASLPASAEAVRRYTEGLSSLRLSDAVAARNLLEKSIEADPRFPLAHAALAEAWSSLGYEGRGRDEAKLAVSLAGRLQPSKRLAVEAQYQESVKSWEKAAEIYDSLFRAFPDDIDQGLRLANAQTRGGKSKAALVTVETLRKLPALLSNDPRIDLEEARAYQELGDFKKQQFLASRAAKKARSSGARLLVARARLLEATALQNMGEIDKALAAIDEARALNETAGDRRGRAVALEQLNDVLYRKGDFDGARNILEKALATYRELGDESSTARVMSNLGVLLVSQGRMGDAEKLLDQALASFKQVDAKYEAGATLNQMGVLLLNRGDLAGALTRYREALAIFSELGEKSGTALTLSNIGEVLANRGELGPARKMNEEALATNREIGDKGGAAYDLYLLGCVFELQGDLLAARQRYEEALAIQVAGGDKAASADTRTSLARLSLFQGRAAEAEKDAREAEEILRTGDSPDHAALAQAVLAESLMKQGKASAALESANGAQSVAEKSEDRRIRLAVAISRGRVLGSSGKPDETATALRVLDAATAEASKAGLVPQEYEARLATGETEIAAGRFHVANLHLAALVKAASSKGLGLVERRALSALEPPKREASKVGS
jgi:eukaryotic-like serine/threonine-protein kinase